MGLGAIRLAEMEEYIRIVTGLLRDETLEATFEGQRRKIRFLNPELGLIDTRTPLGLHVSAYGPKGRPLPAKLDAGWPTFGGDVDSAVGRLDGMRQSWGRPAEAR